jgi:zona occludens toxin (predicted ATPase)
MGTLGAAHVAEMMKLLAVAATAASLAAVLAACSGPADTAKDLARVWLDGDASVQCLGQPAHRDVYELGESKQLESSEGLELWQIELSGTRKGKPFDDAYVLVELREAGKSCVK